MIVLLPPWLGAVFGIVLGAIVGSFLATIVVRRPRGESVSGRSRCDGCARELRPLELIPLVSALVQRGRCRKCGAVIDRRHGLIELTAAVIGGIAGWLSPDVSGLAWAILSWGLLVLAVLDAEHFWLPDRITLPLVVVGLTLGGLAASVPLLDRATGAAAGYLTLRLIGKAYRAVRHRDGLGGGDAKLLGAIGAWLGWQALPFVLLVSSLIALIAVAIAALRGRQIARDTAFPFGTALCLGTLPAWVLLQVLTA